MWQWHTNTDLIGIGKKNNFDVRQACNTCLAGLLKMKLLVSSLKKCISEKLKKNIEFKDKVRCSSND